MGAKLLTLAVILTELGLIAGVLFQRSQAFVD
jgi:hypothetical protein